MIKQNWVRIALQGSFVFLLAACSGTSPASPPDESAAIPASPPTAASAQMEPDEMTQPTPPPGMEPLIEKARDDLAGRLSIQMSQINLVEARSVVWPDSSLGCPQPGMEYKQVPEDGALIVLEAQGTVYEYHTGGSRGLFLCEKGLSKPEKPPQIDITNLTPQILDNQNPTPSSPDQGIPPGEDQ